MHRNPDTRDSLLKGKEREVKGGEGRRQKRRRRERERKRERGEGLPHCVGMGPPNG